MDRTFGTRLREQRERRQLSITAIAADTKIKASLLEGLERDDLTHWPTGIFRRSYIRAYARAIGLDSDRVLREFVELYPDPPEEISALLAETRDAAGTSPSGRPPTRLGFLISSAIGVLPSRRLQPPPRSGTATMNTGGVRSVSSTGGSPPRWAESSGADTAVTLAAGQDLARDEPSSPESPVRGETAGIVAGESHTAVDLPAIADLCSRLACAEHASAVAGVLADAAKLLGAVGVIVWLWDPREMKLRPVMSHGYPGDLIVRLPLVPRDAENGIAIAFRSAETCIIDGSQTGSGAVVVPLIRPAECTGVLALELQNRGEASDSVRACVAILAAQLSTIVGGASLVHTETG